jgi:hypothetical protein
MRPLLPTIALVSSLISVSPCAAQTFSSRPAIFADPVLGVDPSNGELVLGRTTLTSALRIFAVELEDSVRVPLGHPSNPDTVSRQTSLSGVPTLRLRHRLDLGPGRYTLYFDKNERLVAGVIERSRLPRPLRRDELVARYPTLRVEHIGRTAEGAWVRDELVAPLGPCVSLIADVWRQDRGMVGGLGYVYTCPTKPAQLESPKIDGLP